MAGLKLDLSVLDAPGPARGLEAVGLESVGCGPALDTFPLPAVQDVSGGGCRRCVGG